MVRFHCKVSLTKHFAHGTLTLSHPGLTMKNKLSFCSIPSNGLIEKTSHRKSNSGRRLDFFHWGFLVVPAAAVLKLFQVLDGHREDRGKDVLTCWFNGCHLSKNDCKNACKKKKDDV